MVRDFSSIFTIMLNEDTYKAVLKELLLNNDRYRKNDSSKISLCLIQREII